MLLRWIFYCTLMITSSDKTSLCVCRTWGLPAYHFSFISLVTQLEEDNLNLWGWLFDEGGEGPFRRVTRGAPSKYDQLITLPKEVIPESAPRRPVSEH